MDYFMSTSLNWGRHFPKFPSLFYIWPKEVHVYNLKPINETVAITHQCSSVSDLLSGSYSCVHWSWYDLISPRCPAHLPGWSTVTPFLLSDAWLWIHKSDSYTKATTFHRARHELPLLGCTTLAGCTWFLRFPCKL